MALDKLTLITDLQAIFDFEATQEIDADQSRIRFAQKMADAIEKYVKSGDGKYQGGLLAGATAVTSVPNAAVIKMS